MNKALDAISVEHWLTRGGTAFDGTTYLTPESAIPWGEYGCPIVPRQFRLSFGNKKVPNDVSATFGAPDVYLSDLDANAFKRFSIGNSAHVIIDATSRLAYNVSDIYTEVAIPAGVPISWFERLPMSSRTLNGIRRMFHLRGWSIVSTQSVLCRDVLGVRGLGIRSLLELLSVLESVQVEWEAGTDPARGKISEEVDDTISMTRAQLESLELNIAANASQKAVAQMSTPSLLLRKFAEWAMAETNATSFVDAFELALVEDILPEEVTAFSYTALSDISDRPIHPYFLIDKWLRNRSERDEAVFVCRLFSSSDQRLTLEELGLRFNVSRERIRQVAKKLPGRFERFLESPLARPILWRCETLRNMIGVAAPKDKVEHLLAAPPDATDHHHVLLSLAGYDSEGGWYISKTAKWDDPLGHIHTFANEQGRIEEQRITHALAKWGLPSSLHIPWLLRDGRITRCRVAGFISEGQVSSTGWWPTCPT